jgi:hypothetical protein
LNFLGTVFINRSPKHFAEILNIITNFQSCDLWHVPASTQERNELLQEADFYSLPTEVVEALRGKVCEVVMREGVGEGGGREREK